MIRLATLPYRGQVNTDNAHQAAVGQELVDLLCARIVERLEACDEAVYPVLLIRSGEVVGLQSALALALGWPAREGLLNGRVPEFVEAWRAGRYSTAATTAQQG